MRRLAVLLTMACVACGKPRQTQAPIEHRAPVENNACDAPNGTWLGSISNGYNSYIETCENGLRVTTDTTKENQEIIRREEMRKQELAHALVTRVLTEKELIEVGQMGSSLLTHNMLPYTQADVDAKFQSMLLVQQMLRQKEARERGAR